MSEFDRIYYARRAAEEAELAQAAADPDAAAAHRRLQRAYTERASIGDRTLVNVGMADSPVDHVAAIASAHDRYAILIYEWQVSQVLGDGLHVFPILVSPVASDTPGKVFTIAGTSTGVAPANNVACAGESLHF